MSEMTESKLPSSKKRRVVTSSEFVDHEAIKEEACRQLKALLHDVSAPFCCGGTVVLPDTPTITLFLDSDSKDACQKKVAVTVAIEPPYEQLVLSNSDNEDQQLDASALARRRYALNDEALQKQPEALSELLDNAPPALFGKGHETVHDESIRSAKQVPAESFAVNISPQVLADIVDSIRSSLNIQTEIVVEPYSLNLYEKGGKFLKHKDTPRGKDMIGTLILCLPSLFTRGTLVVTKGSEKEYFFTHGHREWQFPTGLFKPGDRNEINPKVVPWCALFSDVDHEITQVSEGVRVTLAYNIRRKDRDSTEAIVPRSLTMDNKQKVSALVAAFQELLDNANFLPDGGRLGFACEHLYTNKEIFPKETTSKDALTNDAINKLKGRDLLLAHAASEANHKVFVVPFLCKTPFMSEVFQNDGEAKYLHKFLPPNMPDFDPEDCADCGDYRTNDEVADLWVVDPLEDGCESQFVGEQEYWGNSGMETDNYYVRAVLLIKLPSAHERTGGGEVKKPPAL